MTEDRRPWAIRELSVDYVKNPTLRHIRDPYSIARGRRKSSKEWTKLTHTGAAEMQSRCLQKSPITLSQNGRRCCATASISTAEPVRDWHHLTRVGRRSSSIHSKFLPE